MNLKDFAGTVNAQDIVLLWARCGAAIAEEAAHGRLPVAIGGGFPRHSRQLHGPLLEGDGDHSSISESFLRTPETALPAELQSAGGDALSRGPQHLAFFVQDASPDSVFTVLLLLAR